MIEIWNYALDCGGKLKVSNFGRVARVFSNKESILSFCKSDRYFKVTLSLKKGEKKKNILVHRLVAKAFIPNPDNKPCVNHKDGNKHNNHVGNLEWCTVAENNRHAALIGLVNSGSATYNSVLSDADVRLIKSIHHSGRASKVAEMFGVSTGVVSNILNGVTYKNVKAEPAGSVWNNRKPNRCFNCKHFSRNGKRYGYCGVRSESFLNVATGENEIVYTQVSSIFVCSRYQSKFKNEV